MTKTELLYNLIRIAICKYIFIPLKCTQEDIGLLSTELNLLIELDNLEYDNWYNLFKKHLKLDGYGELTSLVGYVKNHFRQ